MPFSLEVPSLLGNAHPPTTRGQPLCHLVQAIAPFPSTQMSHLVTTGADDDDGLADAADPWPSSPPGRRPLRVFPSPRCGFDSRCLHPEKPSELALIGL